MAPIRVLVVDDHPVVRQGLANLLAQYPDIAMVGHTDGSGEAEVCQLVVTLQPDVILLDIRLARLNGLVLARRLRSLRPESRVIFLTSYDDEGYLLQAAQVGAHGYLLKSASAEYLADTIRAVHSGEHRLSPSLAGKALRQLEIASRGRLLANSGLSEQDLRLLELIAGGAGVPEIAHQLFLSERTVKRKTQEILEKLGVSNRAHAVAEAYRRGLI